MNLKHKLVNINTIPVNMFRQIQKYVIQNKVIL